jgi:beta-N-acetylhexosaminidase
MFSVPKYFPGYSSDYHPTDSVNNVTNVWSEDFLKPYKKLLSDRDISGIMTAHSYNAHIDSVWHGTLSERTISGLLRDSLGFEGVVISDDLQKPIITSQYDLETVIAQSLNAGVDILYFGNNFEYDEDLAPKLVEAIQNVIRDGRVSVETVEESLARIEKLKKDVIEELCSCFNF